MLPIISSVDTVEIDEVVALYRANGWSSAERPELLLPALRNSHSLVTARLGSDLVGLANAISDGHLVVYFPHMLVHPAHQRRGIGRKLMEVLLAKYSGFHQLMLTAEAGALAFYQCMGFKRAGNTVPMWVYSGTEHGGQSVASQETPAK